MNTIKRITSIVAIATMFMATHVHAEKVVQYQEKVVQANIHTTKSMNTGLVFKVVRSGGFMWAQGETGIRCPVNIATGVFYNRTGDFIYSEPFSITAGTFREMLGLADEFRKSDLYALKLVC